MHAPQGSLPHPYRSSARPPGPVVVEGVDEVGALQRASRRFELIMVALGCFRLALAVRAHEGSNRETIFAAMVVVVFALLALRERSELARPGRQSAQGLRRGGATTQDSRETRTKLT
jgi:hypothetical protein